MDQPVDDCRRHLFVVEDSHPSAEFKVRCDDHAPSLVAVGYDLEEQLRRLTVQRDVSPFVADEKVQLPE